MSEANKTEGEKQLQTPNPSERIYAFPTIVLLNPHRSERQPALRHSLLLEEKVVEPRETG
ncbi:MAG: hypothetical protein IJK60_05405 [Clostridia bacterium]|nr:hypothetical protein [Clostridia bacterium]